MAAMPLAPDRRIFLIATGAYHAAARTLAGEVGQSSWLFIGN
jgi:hypothetical protein